MKRVVRVRADDGSTTIKIEAVIEARTLTRDEASVQASDVARHLAEMLTAVRWTDYGIDNIRVVR